MKQILHTIPGLGLTMLVMLVVAGAVFPLLANGGPVYGVTSLELGYLSPWLSLTAVLYMLGRGAFLGSVFLSRVVFRLPVEALEEVRRPAERNLRVSMAAKTALEGTALAVLAAGLLASLPQLVSAISDHPSLPNWDALTELLVVFKSISVWVFLSLIFFCAIQSARTLWPEYLPQETNIPWLKMGILAGAVLLLTDGGLLTFVLDITEGPILASLAAMLAVGYLESPARRMLASPGGTFRRLWAQSLLIASTAGEIALLLAIMLILPASIDSASGTGGTGLQANAGKYLPVLTTLAKWSLALLIPFIVVHAVAVFRPSVGDIFGFPIGRLTLFGITLLIFADTGWLSTGFNLTIPLLLPAVAMALALSYLMLVVRRYGGRELPVWAPTWAPALLVNLPPLVEMLLRASALALVFWALMNSLPWISGKLIDGELTSSYGRKLGPYLGILYEVRSIMTWFAFTLMAALNLPNNLWSPARWRVRPLLAAAGFAASGCLIWISGVQVSDAGHGYTLAGAIIGLGLIFLGLSQLAAYIVHAERPVMLAQATWIWQSRLRGFLMGGAVAFYALLLRPLLYETFWFAEVFEWIAVVLITLLILARIGVKAKTFSETVEMVPATWTNWNRHEQVFENRPDPRGELFALWRVRFVQSGGWEALWSYLMTLLCLNNVPPASVREVVHPLRVNARSPRATRGRRKSAEERRRRIALSESLQKAEEVLANTVSGPRTRMESSGVDGTALKEASEHYIQSGSEPEITAAMIIYTYRGRGANLKHAVNLWFPLVNTVERPPRWFDLPWVRNRKYREARIRRRNLVDGALAHLSGNADVNSLSVAVVARRVTVSYGGATTATETRVIEPGQAVEVLLERDQAVLIRTADHFEGYLGETELKRQPILPGDEVILAV